MGRGMAVLPGLLQQPAGKAKLCFCIPAWRTNSLIGRVSAFACRPPSNAGAHHSRVLLLALVDTGGWALAAVGFMAPHAASRLADMLLFFLGGATTTHLPPLALPMLACPALPQCRSAFGGPVDPHLVLGGFPTNASSFRNYTADATSFVVTYPIDSHKPNR